MSRFKTYDEFVTSINESKGKFSYGCAMLHFDFPEIDTFHNVIETEDIFTQEGERSYGLETEPHVTLLYGLHSNDLEDDKVIEISRKPAGNLKLGNASVFSNEKYDVLKLDVENDILHEIHSELRKLPHTSDFPKYHPHVTIGYLKSGTGEKYAKKFEGKSFVVSPKRIVYSKPDGSKVIVEL